MTSLEFKSLAQRYYTKVAHEKVDHEAVKWGQVVGAAFSSGCTGCLTLFVVFLAVLFLGSVLSGLSKVEAFLLVGGVVGVLVMPVIGRAVRVRRIVREGVAAYRAGDADAVSAVHGFALGLLRKRVEAHRARTLGPGSEWGRARAPLATALDEAEGRVAYWDERIREEPDSELASLQVRTARKLEAKLRSALQEVDGRAEVLRQFYHRCEAKLAVMDRSNTDLTEVKRLEELSGRADSAIAHAQGTIEALAQHFLAEAQNIARALGSADRSQLGMLAGAASYDNVEFLADKIHESSERDRSTIQQLEKTLDD